MVETVRFLGKKGQTQPNTRPPDPTRDPYFSGWIGFLPDKPDCYRVGLRVAVKPTRPDPISVLDTAPFFHGTHGTFTFTHTILKYTSTRLTSLDTY